MNFNKLTNKRNGETFTKGTYKGIKVYRRDYDGYINATKLCEQFGKRFSTFIKRNSWEYYLESFKEEYGNEPNSSGVFIYTIIELIISDEIKEASGTYIHPGLVNYVMSWASAKCAVKVGKIIDSMNNRQPYRLNQDEIDDLRKDKREYDLAKIEFEKASNNLVAAGKKIETWGKFIKQYCE